MSQPIVIFMFAGRRANMEIQMPYLERILDEHQNAVLHLWDLTRDPADQRYLRSLEGRQNGRVAVLGHLHGGHPIKCMYPLGYQGRRPRGFPPCSCLLHKPPYEEPYKWYVADTFDQNPDNTIYVKVDDDVLFLETDRFGDLIAPLEQHPNRIISANVINNVVCAKYLPGWERVANQFMVGDPSQPKNDKRWWTLHENPKFAEYMHQEFLRDAKDVLSGLAGKPSYIRTRPGECVSINCIAFTHSTMRRLAAMMDDKLGDEGAVDKMLPWICTSFHVAHLSFGPQEKSAEVDWNEIRGQYTRLSKEYLV